MYHFLTTILFVILSMLPLHALEMRVLAWDQTIAERDLSIAMGSKSEAITGMHHFARTEPIKVPSDSKSLKLQINDKLSEDGKPLTLPISIGASIQQPLLLIIPHKSHPSGLGVIVIEDSAEDFAWGSMRFVNLTREELVFVCEKKSKLIPTGWKPSLIRLQGNSRNMGVSMYLKKNLKGPRLYSAIWKHEPNQRKLIFIIPSKDKSRGVVELKFIVERQV